MEVLSIRVRDIDILMQQNIRSVLLFYISHIYNITCHIHTK